MRSEPRLSDPDLRSPVVEVPTEPRDPFTADLVITWPGPGDARIDGDWYGVSIVVKGQTTTTGNGVLDRVVVAFGGDDAAPATAKSAAWRTWEFLKLVTESGTYPVTARAFDAKGRKVGEQSASVTIALAPKPADPAPHDPPNVAPTVTIQQPVGGTSFGVVAARPVEIEISGETADPDGSVVALELLVDGIPVAVQPAPRWSAKARLAGIGPHTITARVTDNAQRTASARVEVETVKSTARPVVERLMIVEKCDLLTLRAGYGIGETIKVVAMAPGAKETMSIKSYRRDTHTASEAASILDSHEESTRKRFEQTVEREQSNKSTQEERKEWRAEAQLDAKLGMWGSVSVKGGMSGSSNAAREEMAKTLEKALSEHASDASSKRQQEVKTSAETKLEQGTELTSETRIENVNLSRTLNFVFSQVVEEFISALAITDVRVSYLRGDLDPNGGAGDRPRLLWSYEEVSLAQLDPLLRRVIVPERIDKVRGYVMDALANVFDYEDEPHALFEIKELHDPTNPEVHLGSYLRFPRRKTSTYVDEATGARIVVRGIILSMMRNVMRSDGVVCDAVLGQGEALDAYNQALQHEAVTARRLENGRAWKAVQKEDLARRLVESRDQDGAAVFRQVYPPEDHESLALVTAPAAPNGSPSK